MEHILGPEYTPNVQDVLQSYVYTHNWKLGQLTYRCVYVHASVRLCMHVWVYNIRNIHA